MCSSRHPKLQLRSKDLVVVIIASKVQPISQLSQLYFVSKLLKRYERYLKFEDNIFRIIRLGLIFRDKKANHKVRKDVSLPLRTASLTGISRLLYKIFKPQKQISQSVPWYNNHETLLKLNTEFLFIRDKCNSS